MHKVGWISTVHLKVVFGQQMPTTCKSTSLATSAYKQSFEINIAALSLMHPDLLGSPRTRLPGFTTIKMTQHKSYTLRSSKPTELEINEMRRQQV